jgi:hypothetical protein
MGSSDNGSLDGERELASFQPKRWTTVVAVVWGVLCTFLLFALLLNWI